MTKVIIAAVVILALTACNPPHRPIDITAIRLNDGSCVRALVRINGLLCKYYCEPEVVFVPVPNCK